MSDPKFTGVSHIELTVRDADRSAAWYERVLLMKRLDTNPDGVHGRLAHVMHMRTGLTFGLIQHASGDDGEFSEFRVGLDHLKKEGPALSTRLKSLRLGASGAAPFTLVLPYEHREFLKSYAAPLKSGTF